MAATSNHNVKSNRGHGPLLQEGRGQQALRIGRVSLPSHAYHVTTATSRREPVFASFAAARILATCLNDNSLLGDARTLAWIAMPDHLHWLVQLGEALTLNALVQRMKSASSRRINRVLGLNGALWQRAYYDHLVRNDENLRELARYIVANPVRAGLVGRAGDYPHWDAIWLE